MIVRAYFDENPECPTCGSLLANLEPIERPLTPRHTVACLNSHCAQYQKRVTFARRSVELLSADPAQT